MAIEVSLIVDKKMVCVVLYFVGLLQDLTECENLVDGGLAKSEAALIGFNQCFDEWLQSFLQYARKHLICRWFLFLDDFMLIMIIFFTHNNFHPL